jgi:pimeloyl-ACP methyl ester carboxylesterase
MKPEESVVLPTGEVRYLYLHGFLSGPESIKGKYFAEQMESLGISLVRLDLKGEHPEEMTLTSQLKILEEEIARISGTVVLLGSSLGAYLALLAAERHRNVRRLVLIAPAFEFPVRFFRLLSEEQLRQWEQKGELPFFFYSLNREHPLKYDFVRDLEHYRTVRFGRQLPVQIFHGVRDEVVPYQLSVEYLESHPMTDLILLNTDHGMLDKMDVMWEYMKQFLGIPRNG